MRKVHMESVRKKLECVLLLFYFFIEDILGLKIVHQPLHEYVEVCTRRLTYQNLVRDPNAVSNHNHNQSSTTVEGVL